MKTGKRKLLIATILIIVIIFILLNLILIKNFLIQKKQIKFNQILKSTSITPITENNNILKTINYQAQKSDWRIVIQKINLNAPILEGTTKEVLRRGVGHFVTTATLDGNVCLAAHNRGYKYNYFQEIKKLEVGDLIEYQTLNKNKTYEVIRNEVIKETDITYLQNTKENKLTLITCEENKKEYRRCIQAKEI